MIYLIDGYNLLFKLFHSGKKFETQRKVIIDFLHEKAILLKIKIHLVFDGYKQNQLLPQYSDHNNLKVIYTAKDQTADDYILHQILLSKTPNQIVVVTSDNTLKIKARQLHAQVKSIQSFIDWITEKELQIKKSKQVEEETFVDTKKNIERLLKIFEDKLKQDLEDLD